MTKTAVKLNLLRLAMLAFLGLGYAIQHAYIIGIVGYSGKWTNEGSYVEAGSHPAILAWAFGAILLFFALMRTTGNEATAGVPSLWRRFAAFLIDFWFSTLTLSSTTSLLPLWLESMRTGHFSWKFERNYSFVSDLIFAFPFALILMGLMFLYFVFPLTKGKQTVGCFIMRLRVTPPFGDRGRFTFRDAVRRTWYEFRGLCSWLFWIKDGLDSQGRTWYDVETNCTVVLIDYL